MESGDAGDFENRLPGPTNLTALGSDSSKLLSGVLTALRQTGGHIHACSRSAAKGGIGAARTCPARGLLWTRIAQLPKQRVRKSGCEPALFNQTNYEQPAI